tara:strand:+ start:945 stop:1370 length:426 start_codon:yes stop_codon:yes gene_type:complete
MKKLMVVLAMFTTGMVAAQSSSTTEHEKFNEIVFLIDKFYTEKDWNKSGVRESVISMCRKKLKENNLDILSPIYREVQIVFRDKKDNMNKLLSSKCKDYVLDEDDYIRYSWDLKGNKDTWFLITLEIESNGIRYGMSEYKN